MNLDPSLHEGTLLCIAPKNKLLVRLFPDGTIEYGSDYDPDETAQVLWQAVANWAPELKIAELQTEVNQLKERARLADELAAWITSDWNVRALDWFKTRYDALTTEAPNA